MDETMILYCVAAVMSTVGGIVLFREARKRNEAVAQAEAEFKAEDEAEKLAKEQLREKKQKAKSHGKRHR